MDVWGVLIGAVSGLFSGAVGGVFASGQIAWRGEAAKHRFQAQAAVCETLAAYRVRLIHGHTYTGGVCNEGLGAASFHGREQLACAVLAKLPHLAPRARKRVHRHLLDLVGAATVELASKRIGVPESDFDQEAEVRREETVKHKLSLETGVRDGKYVEAATHGALGIVYVSPNDVEHHAAYFQAALDIIDKMMSEVSPRRR
ncbi:hypothetical protein IMZ11_34140 [Microtetraspora sp. AC03309]|uniref:hypothetical protein n=1 Tax=Microtetraspora sp. AC03309 TaxID=2779376 RepID=UPI001E5DEF8B|nr:hypothetical protein [Microtetraspora sp. AC03309]MCC5580671.1 hypothetical protein [Microtetraspora sp. AC03309]